MPDKKILNANKKRVDKKQNNKHISTLTRDRKDCKGDKENVLKLLLQKKYTG